MSDIRWMNTCDVFLISKLWASISKHLFWLISKFPIHPVFFLNSRGEYWSVRRMLLVSWWRSALRIYWMVPSANWHCSLETNSSSAKPTWSSGACWSRSSARFVTSTCTQALTLQTVTSVPDGGWTSFFHLERNMKKFSMLKRMNL